MTSRSPVLAWTIASLIVTWGICPPAIRHAHVGGTDSSHRHVAGARFHSPGHSHPHGRVQKHEHSHPHAAAQDARSSRTGAEDTEIARIGGNAVHLHWAILGFDIAMPAPLGSPAPGRPLDSEPVVVPVAGHVPAVLVSGEFSGRVERPVDEGTFVDVCTPLPPGFWRTNSLAALPLCDRARLERSGVLLA